MPTVRNADQGYRLVVLARTRTLWKKQTRLVGDRRAHFDAVADVVDAESVLYPGSYVDLTPSLTWPSVTYVDVDRRAAQFFADTEGVDELLHEARTGTSQHLVRFIHDDYTTDLDIAG